MAGMTSAQLLSELEVLVEISGTDIDTSLLRYMNAAGRELWASRMWDKRKKEVVLVTVAPYITGTVTVTNGSTTLTGSGTTFTSAMTGRKFALSAGGPFYRVTYVSATEMTLARAYQETTASAQTYTIFQDEYDVASDLNVLRSISALHTTDRGHLGEVTEAELDARSYLTRSEGTPLLWAPCVETTAGTYRIRLYPIPDAVYAFRVLYLKAWTALANDSNYHGLGENCDRLLLMAAALMAQHIPGAQRVTSEAEVAALTEKVWREQQMQVPLTGTRRTFDDGGAYASRIGEIDLDSL